MIIRLNIGLMSTQFNSMCKKLSSTSGFALRWKKNSSVPDSSQPR